MALFKRTTPAKKPQPINRQSSSDSSTASANQGQMNSINTLGFEGDQAKNPIKALKGMDNLQKKRVAAILSRKS